MNSIRLIKQKRETRETRQAKALAEIQAEHAKSNWTPIARQDGRKALPTDQILSRSYRKTDNPNDI